MQSIAPEGLPPAQMSPDERVVLRPLRHDDRDAVRRWMRDLTLIRFTVLVPGPEYGPVRPYSASAADRYLAVLVDDPQRRTFAICVDGRHVGNVGLRELNLETGHAECFVEVGELEARGRGYAKTALSSLLTYAFEALALRTVRLGVFEFNRKAIGLYERLGFERTGRYGLHWAEGRYWEVFAMELARGNWAKRHRAPLTTRVDAH